MSQATNYLEGKLLDHICGLASYTAPATLYLCKFTAMADGEVPTFTEVAGGSYARAALTNDGSLFTRTGTVIKNDGIIPFAAASAPWGSLTHWGLADHPTAGNLLIYGELTDPISVLMGATYRVAAEQLAITFNFRSNYLGAAMIDHVFGITPYTAPADLDIALYTAAPTDAGGGTEVATGATDYDRVEIPNDASSWTRTLNEVVNDNDIEWLEAAAAYGTVQAQAAFEAGTSNMMWWKNLAVNQPIGLGSMFAFTPGQYRVSLN